MTKLLLKWQGNKQDTIKIPMRVYQFTILSEEEQNKILRTALNKKRKETSDYDWNCLVDIIPKQA